MTRRALEKLTNLIRRADAFTDPAKEIQNEARNDREDLLRQLADEYGTWYAEALTALPSDHTEAFRKEYEGGFPNYKIKHFLQAGLELNKMFAELAAQGTISKWLYPVNSSFLSPLAEQKQILRNTMAGAGGHPGLLAALDMLEDVFRRLPVALAVLRQDVRGRPGLVVSDEYDLQRIVHAVLCLHHLDVRPEEYGPSRAGAHPRLDFLLKEERVAVETKMTRSSLGPRQLGNELAQDILRYRAHDHADAYFALVHDPEKHILNASGFEQDFAADPAFPVRVVIIQ
ncbi:hypothetical protein ACFY19_31325 [Streptosporangium saharense]|uniref:PD-(D/E)XK nuclease domain-containing protein n=1 Tax=Streptosporangium saharense TaxID=1706840 RepID=UPI00367BE0DF